MIDFTLKMNKLNENTLKQVVYCGNDNTSLSNFSCSFIFRSELFSRENIVKSAIRSLFSDIHFCSVFICLFEMLAILSHF